MQKVIVVTGPTATGKTSFALKLVRELNGLAPRSSKSGVGELISADSRQIYQYLDIITGKDLPDNSEFHQASVVPVPRPVPNVVLGKTGIQTDRSRIKYGMTDCQIGYYLINGIRLWGYDALDPKIASSSFYFKRIADEMIADTISRGKIPIIVGGSYLYLKHLLYGFETESILPDWNLRKELENKTITELADILRSKNAQMFDQLNISDKKNPHRLMRKIEIAQTMRDGKTPGVKGAQTPGVRDPGVTQNRYQITQFIGCKFARQEDLISNIGSRVEARLKKGAVLEVKKLLKMGYTKTDPGLKTIGYSQIIDHLKGNLSLEEAIRLWKLAEVQYAKRQYTFMKSDPNIRWTNI